jgi:hypothetical protein
VEFETFIVTVSGSAHGRFLLVGDPLLCSSYQSFTTRELPITLAQFVYPEDGNYEIYIIDEMISTTDVAYIRRRNRKLTN